MTRISVPKLRVSVSRNGVSKISISSSGGGTPGGHVDLTPYVEAAQTAAQEAAQSAAFAEAFADAAEESAETATTAADRIDNFNINLTQLYQIAKA